MKNKKQQESQTVIDYHFIKNQQFRTIHVDGVSGNLTPRGLISMTVYNERFPIPQVVKQKGFPDESKADSIIVQTKSGVIRDLECNLIIDIDVAKTIVNFLTDCIQDAVNIKSIEETHD